MKKRRHLIDLHVHTNFSDGKLSIDQIVDYYGRRGYSAIAITDHLADSKSLTGKFARRFNLSLNENSMPDYLNSLYHASRRALNQYNMLLIHGVEITLNSWTRQNGAHLIFLNIDKYIDPNQPLVDLLKKYPNYFSIAAHPKWEKPLEFKTTQLWNLRHELCHLIDAWECATADKFSQEVWDSNFPIVASSDFHAPTISGCWRSQIYSDSIDWQKIELSIRNRTLEPIWTENSLSNTNVQNALNLS